MPPDASAALLAEIEALERAVDQRDLNRSPALLAQVLSRDDMEPWRPYRWLMFLDQKITALVDGSLGKTRLLVTAPPRHGKSLECSLYLPTWYLRRHPNRRVILASYGDDYAAEWGRKVRDLIDTHSDVLGIRVSKSNSAADRWELDGTTGGMKTVGVGGGVTGRGCHLLVIDDPVKDAEEAQSLTLRDKKWDWWRSTIQTRLEPGAVIVLIQTRWSEDDLAGRILEHEADKWEVINLPALAEEDDPLGRVPGEALCPERYDENALGAIRESITAGPFASLYQQRPTPDTGGRFKRATFRYWTDNPEAKAYLLNESNGERLMVPKADCGRFATVDTAVSTRTQADYTVAAVWDVASWLEPSRLLLVDRVRVRVDDPLTVIADIHARYKPTWIGVEDTAVSATVIAQGLRRGLPIRKLKPGRRDKFWRTGAAITALEASRVYFPRRATWISEWEHELLVFPNGAHDDQVDVFSYAAEEFLKGYGAKPRPKPPEPQTIEERCWAQLQKKSVYDHPLLGRLRA